MTAAMANILSVRSMFFSPHDYEDVLIWYGFARVSPRRTRSTLSKGAFSLPATGKVASPLRLPVVLETASRNTGELRRSAAHLLVLHSLFFLETLVQLLFLLLAHAFQFVP